MAKKDKKTGITEADAQAYKDLNKELPDPFREDGPGSVRGPEQHPNRNYTDWHIHVGPVDHIGVNDLNNKSSGKK